MSHLSGPMILSFGALILWIGLPSLALGLSAAGTYFIGLAPLPHPGCVGCTDSEAVTRVRLQLHQFDGSTQDLVEDPGAVLDLGHLLVALLGCLLQQHLVEADLLLAHRISPGNLGEERARASSGLAWPTGIGHGGTSIPVPTQAGLEESAATPAQQHWEGEELHYQPLHPP